MEFSAVAHGLDFGKNAPGYVRSPGVHMSDLYNSLYERLEPKRFNHDTPMPMDKMEIGMVWEEIIEREFRKRVGVAEGTAWRPGEFVTPEGIAYSPDLLIANGTTRLGEIKATWMSCRNVPISKEQAEAAGRPDLANKLATFDDKFSKWFTQIKAYLYHLKLTEARLIVLFLNGNYKPPSPVPLAWDLAFTQRELDEEWAMLVNHAKAEGMIQ